MLRVGFSLMSTTATYFLDGVYTKEEKAGATRYVEIIEKVMKSFQGKRQSSFTGINGTVSDSARACVKAKRLLAEKHAGMVMLQDQAHATDLLMSDLGKLPWIEYVLNKVSGVVQVTRNNRKLLSRFKDLIEEHNRNIKDPQKRIEETLITEVSSELEELNEANVRSTIGISAPDASLQRALNDDRGQSVSSSTLDLRPTAITLKKTVKTRFASTETMLESYLRSRSVLRKLIKDPEFDRLYDVSRSGNRDKRDKCFVKVIEDDSFYRKVRDVHAILRAIRRYLRVWDAEGAQISEVVPATILLDHNLKRLPESEYVTSDRKKEVLKALQRRCTGPTVETGGAMQIRILQDVHFAAWLLDPVLCPSNVNDYLPALRRHLSVYLRGAKQNIEIGKVDGLQTNCKELEEKLVRAYREVHKGWKVLKAGTTNNKILNSYAGHPLRYWEDEQPTNMPDLERFAVNTLSLCPSSCATERSFSHQGRIHTKQRSRLAPEVVRNLLFCNWNARVLRSLDRLNFDKDKDYSKVKLGSFKPYEDFLRKTNGRYILPETSEEVLERIMRKEYRVQSEIVKARSTLYDSLSMYTLAGSMQDSEITRVEKSLTTSSQSHRGSASNSFATDNPLSTPQRQRANTTEELRHLLSLRENMKRRNIEAASRMAGTERAGEQMSTGFNVDDGYTISEEVARVLLQMEEQVKRPIKRAVRQTDGGSDIGGQQTQIDYPQPAMRPPFTTGIQHMSQPSLPVSQSNLPSTGSMEFRRNNVNPMQYGAIPSLPLGYGYAPPGYIGSLYPTAGSDAPQTGLLPQHGLFPQQGLLAQQGPMTPQNIVSQQQSFQTHGSLPPGSLLPQQVPLKQQIVMPQQGTLPQEFSVPQSSPQDHSVGGKRSLGDCGNQNREM